MNASSNDASEKDDVVKSKFYKQESFYSIHVVHTI